MLLKITSKAKNFHYVNPAFIVSVTIDVDVCLNMPEGTGLWIDNAEWQRIEPLLVMPVETVVPQAPSLPAEETVEYDRAMAVVSAIHGFENTANDLLTQYLRFEPMRLPDKSKLLQALVDFYLAVVSADILATSGDAS
jgi:hypothetical protein